ncbi:MAG: DUF1194 domain-containing protein [Alphaproteobacteria bacterium]
MRWLLALMLSCLPFAAQAQGGQAQTAKSVDIAIVVSLDRSESIDAADARAQIDGLVFTLRHSRFRDSVATGWFGRIALTVVTWSSFGRHEVILPWMQVAGVRDADIAATILELDYARQSVARHGTQTDVAFAIEVGMNQLDTLPWQASKSVINVVADGISNIGRVAMADRNLALARGFTVNGLIMARGSAIEVLSRYFRREVIGGPTSFLQVSASNEDFADAMLRKILLEMVRLRQPRSVVYEIAG